jgi:hypothetical protein
VDSVDTQNQSFFAALWIGATDNRSDSATAAFQSSYNNVSFDYKTLPRWHITFLNVLEMDDQYINRKLPTLRSFDEEDPITFYQRMQLKARFSNPFELEAFPFDVQLLTMHISLDANLKCAQFDAKWMAEHAWFDDERLFECVAYGK